MNEPSPTSAESAVPEIPPKRRGCFGMALKTTLGCAAFALGAFVVLVVLLPSLLEGFARSTTESAFAELCQGTISIRELSLSWRKPQRITDAVLYDPDKREVARVTAEVPPILALFSPGKTWHVRVDVDADLVADDQGVVNLQRAIAPRPEAKRKTTVSTSKDSSNPLDQLSTLDVEIVVASRRLSWSDADTRKRGQPFEIRGFTAEVRVKPGQPLTIHAKGDVVSDAPGALEVDATLHGPIDPRRSWPFGDVDAKVRLAGFSTPMIDGVAGLGGKLTEVLGPSFDLQIGAAGVTPEKGQVDVGLSSARSSFAFAGEFAGGSLRSRDGAPIRLELGVPRGFVTEALKANLPPRVAVAWEETDKPWTVTVEHLELPVPDASATGAAGLAKMLEHLRCDVAVDLPARISFQSEETKAAKLDAAVKGLKLAFAAAPGNPARLRLETTIDTGSDSPLTVEATVPEPWKAISGGGVPAFDATVRVQGLATATIDALAAQNGRISGALGPTLAVTADVHAADAAHADRRTVAVSIETPRMKIGLRGSGDAATWLRSEGDEGFDLTWTPADGWIDREAAAFLPAGTSVHTHPGAFEIRGRGILVPAVPAGAPAVATLADSATFDLTIRTPAITVASLAEGNRLPPADLDPLGIDAKLAKGGTLSVAVHTGLSGGTLGRVTIEAGAEKLSAVLAQSPGAVANAKLSLEGLSTATLDVLAGQPGFVSGALGPSLSITGGAKIEGAKIAGSVDATSPTTKLHASGRLENGRVAVSGDDTLHLSSAPSDRWLADRIAKSLPPGASLAFADASRPIEVDVTEFALPMPVKPEALACKITCKFPGLHYVGAQAAGNAGAKTEANVHDLVLAAEVAPGKPLHAKVDAAVDAGAALGGGKLAADVTVPDPWAMLGEKAPAIPALDADVKLDGLPTASLDAIAGKPGFVSGLFGPAANLAILAKIAGADSGTVNVSFASDAAKVSASAKLEKGVVVGTGDSAVEVAANLTPAWIDAQLGPLLPKGAKLALAGPSGAFGVHVKDLRMPLPTGPVTADALAKASLHLTASVPDLAYTDPSLSSGNAGGAAGNNPPAVVRGLAVDANVAPGKPPEAKVTAKVEGTPPGDLSATVRALDPLTLLAEEKGLERFHVAADVVAKALPTGLVDALAAQGGLLVDVLGPRFDLAVHSDSISQSDGTFTASLDSEKASVHCDHGGMKDKVLHLEKSKGKNEAVLARALLSPLFSEKVVGNLVPALVNVEKPKPNDPVTVAVEDLAMPLDADLSKLDAIVRVNLGDVIAHPLPGLSGFLGKSGGVNLNIPEIRVPIQKGVASYDGLPLPIGGKTYPLKGTFNLVDKSFKMQTQIPLSVLGSGVNGKLDGLRNVLDPNTLVPIEIRGTWKSPKISVGDDFLKKVGEDALKKQGGNLLEGLFKKKK